VHEISFCLDGTLDEAGCWFIGVLVYREDRRLRTRALEGKQEGM